MCVNGAFYSSPAIRDSKVIVLSLHSRTILPYASRAAARTTGAPLPLTILLNLLYFEVSIALQHDVLPESLLTRSGRPVKQNKCHQQKQNRCNMAGRC